MKINKIKFNITPNNSYKNIDYILIKFNFINTKLLLKIYILFLNIFINFGIWLNKIY